MEKCDLLESYSESDKQVICQQSNVDVGLLQEKKLEGEETDDQQEDDIIFVDDI
jgi:hypothetical protein